MVTLADAERAYYAAAAGITEPALSSMSLADLLVLFYASPPGGGSTPDADATTKGKLKLAGDLGGTAALPTISAAGIAKSKGLGLGLTGATGDTRLVGRTVSGAPVAGTFAVGDIVVDETGQLWICITAGTPGTWQPAGAGVELAYLAIAATETTTAAATAPEAFTTLDLTFTIPNLSRPYYVEAGCGLVSNDTAARGTSIYIGDATTYNVYLHNSSFTSATSAYAGALRAGPLRIAAGSGSKVFKLWKSRTGASGIATLSGGVAPIILRAWTG